MRLCGPQIVFVIVVVMWGMGSMLSGCGKKGPLYLPDERGEELGTRDEKRHLAVPSWPERVASTDNSRS